jgi:hypothetical protein
MPCSLLSRVVVLASPGSLFEVGLEALLSTVHLTVIAVPIHPEGIPMVGESLGNLLVGWPLCSLLGDPGQGGRVIEAGLVDYPSLGF